MKFMSPPATPPHDAGSPVPSNAGASSSTSSIPTFRLPSQPTILLKAPSDETVARLRQLAPYYWSHPNTTNCAIHFPIDPVQQARIQAYQARQRTTASQSRSRQGSVTGDPSRRPSWTPPPASPIHPQSPIATAKPGQPRLRAVHSGSGLGLSARASILGTSANPEPTMDGKRRGSITPGYDPFSKSGTSIVVGPAPAGRRESVPFTPSQIPNSPTSPASSLDTYRRGSTPATKSVTPMRTVRLHVEYLTAQSALIRQILAETAGYKSVPDSGRATPTPTPTASSFPSSQLATPPPEGSQEIPPDRSNPFPHSFFRFSPHRYPRVIHPRTAGAPPGPIIILPVPDPVSFPLLIHYMYHGKMDSIERTLREGQVSWEGLVRNVEYLGLRDDVKRYLGRWWKNWRDQQARGTSAEVEEDDEEASGDNKKSYPYPGPKDMKMDVDGDDDVGEWTASASASAATGELVDEMAGLLDRF